MGFKQKLIKDFQNQKDILSIRYGASKVVLVISALLFFTSFFFVGAGYKTYFYIDLVGIFYLLLVISFYIFLYLFFCNTFGEKVSFSSKIILVLFLSVFSLLLASPVLYEGGIYGLYNDFLN